MFANKNKRLPTNSKDKQKLHRDIITNGRCYKSFSFMFHFSSVFIFFEAFCLTLVKKNRQNEESRENVATFSLLSSF